MNHSHTFAPKLSIDFRIAMVRFMARSRPRLASTMAIVVALLFGQPVKAGLLFDDPLEIKAEPVYHAFSKDELRFTLSGKCKDWLVFQPEVTLELRYADGTTKLVAAQQFWATTSPLIFTLPKPYSQLNSMVLRGKYRILGTVIPNPKGKGVLPDGQRYDLKPILGYKIDSKWTTK